MSRRLVLALFAAALAASGGAQAGDVRTGQAAHPRRGADYARYLAALDAAAAGRRDEARKALEALAAADPASSDVQLSLSQVCLEGGELDCAEKSARRAVDLAPDSSASHAALADVALARWRASRGPADLETALGELQLAADRAPRDPAVTAGLIRVLGEAGRLDDAERAATKFLDAQGADQALVRLTLARTFLAKGAIERAIGALAAVDAHGRGAATVLETLADLQGSRGDQAGRAVALERLRRIKPDDADVAHRLGVARLEAGDFLGAEEPLRAAVAGRPDDPLVQRDLARVLVRLGRGAEALPVLRGLPRIYWAPHTLLLWAQAAEQGGAPAEAAEKLETLYEAFGAEDRANFGAALLVRAAGDRARAGDHAGALRLLEKAPADDPDAFKLRVAELTALGRGGEAQELLAARRKARPGDAAAAALAALAADKPADGADAALSALAGADDRAQAVAQTAALLAAWDKPQVGAALLDRAGAAGGAERPELLRLRAEVYFAAGRSAEAETAFRRLLSAAPNDAGTLNDLGWLLTSEGRSLSEAIDLLRRAVQIKPSQPQYLDSLGWALHRAGRSSEALPLLQQAARLSAERGEAEIREHLGDVYQALGDPSRARAEWTAALAIGSGDADRLRRKLAAAPQP